MGLVIWLAAGGPVRAEVRPDTPDGDGLKGEWARAAAGLVADPPFGDQSVALVKDGRPTITIVHGKQDAVQAGELRDQLSQALAVDVPMAEVSQVLAPRKWRPADKWLAKNLLLVGNIYSNRLLMGLHGKFLVGANATYPGPGRYEIRVVFAPFHRDGQVVVVAGSDRDGLGAGIKRFLRLTRILVARGSRKTPPFIELGSAAGPDRPAAYRGSRHLSRLVDDFYWHGHLPAARLARENVLGGIRKRPREWAPANYPYEFLGHYKWVGPYRNLRQLQAAGILRDQDLRLLDERLVQNALETADWYAQCLRLQNPPDSPGEMDEFWLKEYRVTRHGLTGLLGIYLLVEYLHSARHVPPDKQAAVDRAHEALHAHLDYLLQHRRFRGVIEGYEGLDVLGLLAEFYLDGGDERLVRDDILRNMADCYLASMDNLGYVAGTDVYTSAGVGTHHLRGGGGLALRIAASVLRDGQFRWLAENLSWFNPSHGYGSRVPSWFFALPTDLAAAPPDRDRVLTILPMDNRARHAMRSLSPSEVAVPVEAGDGALFSKAIFRDGLGPEDAYLMLQSLNTHLQHSNQEPFQANSIPRYTELGSLLLFHNSRLQTSWVRNVVSTSRGQHDPQSGACVLEGRFRTPSVAAVCSTLTQAGGVSWRRCIFRRRGAYFVVLDEMTPHADDTYHFTCRWRSFHPGALERVREFRATDPANGTELHIVASAPVSQEVRLEPRDGTTEPTMLRQRKTAQLKKGQHVSLQNLLYATNEQVSRDFDIRRLADRAVLVKGRSKESEEIAAMGTESFGPLESITGECRLWYLSDRTLAISGSGRLTLKGGAEAEKLVRLEPGEHVLEARDLPEFFQGVRKELEQLWRRAEVRAAVPAEMASRNLDYPDPWREIWRYGGLEPPRRRHLSVKASAEPPTTVGAPDAWVDRRYPYRTPLAGWKTGAGGAILLDLGEEVDLDSVRLIGDVSAFGAFKQGGASFEIVLSNDDFAKDVRKVAVPEPRFDIYYISLARLWMFQLPSFVLPIGQRARHVKIATSWPELKGAVTFGEIEVTTRQPAPRVETKLLERGFFGRNRMALLAASGRRLVMLQPNGRLAWKQDLGSELLTVTAADVDSDRKEEILVCTQAERLYAFNGDGTRRFVHNIRQGKVKYGTVDGGGYTILTPGTISAWRPDEKGNLEYCFFPHVKYGRVTAEPELEQSVFSGPGAKHVFTIPDLGDDGREELALVGQYQMQFSVLDSQSDLANGKLDHIVSHFMPGYSCGNNELPMYYDGAVVRDARGRWLGVLVLNPGAVIYYAAPDLSPAWHHFSHPPNTCSALADLDGDRVPEVLVGREDGFVTRYAVADGKVVGKVSVGHTVRALITLGEQVAVGSDQGIVLLDRKLRIVGCRPGAVSALAVLRGRALRRQILAAALDTGDIVGLRLQQR